MKTKLHELSISQFIDLICGEKTVLLENGEKAPDEVLHQFSTDIISSYRLITDNANLKSQLMDKEDNIKLKIRIVILIMCQNLVNCKAYDEVRTLLELIDENAQHLDNSDLSSKLEELLRFALFEQLRNEEKKSEDADSDSRPSADDIRSSFYAEVAFLMTYFKMNIDMNVVNAMIYANMVHQADGEIRAKGGRIINY